MLISPEVFLDWPEIAFALKERCPRRAWIEFEAKCVALLIGVVSTPLKSFPFILTDDK